MCFLKFSKSELHVARATFVVFEILQKKKSDETLQVRFNKYNETKVACLLSIKCVLSETKEELERLDHTH
jgi:hypothetical protein